jgi:catechol 2,3-dioxygenase-like lactoylglutathione lyase family enzyme
VADQRRERPAADATIDEVAQPPHPSDELAGLHHVSLTVSNLDRSLAFYQRVLGMRPIGENNHDGGRTVVLTHRRTGFVLLLQQHKAHEGTRFSEFRPGLDHLSFRVAGREALAAWAAHLDGLGVERQSAHEDEWGSVIIFRDPDRIQLELFVDPAAH